MKSLKTIMDLNGNQMIIIQQQLVLLFHAHECSKINDVSNCQVFECSKIRDFLSHSRTCSSNQDCGFENCWSLKQIMNHWIKCRSIDCVLCSPLRAN